MQNHQWCASSVSFNSLLFTAILFCQPPPHRYYLEDVEAKKWRVHHGVIEKKLGSAPNDPSTFQIKDLMSMEVS
eukprot:93683-Pelagomonas_calceolata.AAC.1